MRHPLTPKNTPAPFKAVALLAISLAFTGCVGVADLHQSATFSEQYNAGNYVEAIQSVGDYDEENLLSALNIGSAQWAAGQFAGSTDSFDRAEEKLLWKADKVDSVAEVGRAVGTFLTSDLTAKYTGNIYEGTLINTYKALSAIQLGDFARARVEFNRADSRQDNAQSQLGKKVAAMNRQASKYADDEKTAAHATKIDASVANSLKPDTALGKRLAVVESLKQYAGLRNPLTDYLHGVFRLVTGDANKASDLLRNTVALTDEKNAYVINDFALAERVAKQTSGTFKPRVWVIYEDGIGADLQEFRIDFPTFVVSDHLLYAGVAVPEFVPGRAANGALKITASGKQIKTKIVLETDRLISTEFRTTYKRVVAKAISSAIVKSLIAYELNKQTDDEGWLGALTKIAITITQSASTHADTRIWRGLPHTVGVASLEFPQDGVIVLQGRGGQPEHIDLNALGLSGKHVMITAKAVNNEFVSWYAASL